MMRMEENLILKWVFVPYGMLKKREWRQNMNRKVLALALAIALLIGTMAGFGSALGEEALDKEAPMLQEMVAAGTIPALG